MIRVPDLRRLSVFLVCGFIPVAVLWKGGKSLESTWVLLFVAWVVTLIFWSKEDKNDTDSSGAVWLSAMLLTLWTIMSYLFSQTGNYGLDEVFRTGALSLILLWSARHPTSRETVLRVIAWTAFASVMIGTCVYVLQPVARFVGTFFDARFTTDYWPNAWAEFVLLSWPLVILHARRSGNRLWFLVSGILMGGLLLSYSRGAYIAFGGQVVLLIIATVLQRQCWNRKSFTIATTLAISAIAVAMFYGVNTIRSQFHTVQNLEEKITFTAAEGSSSVDERKEFMKQALQLMKERPIVGYGPYSFRFAQTKMQHGVYATSDHPHNIFLKLAAELGIPAVGFFVILLLTILGPACMSIIGRKDDEHTSLIVIAIAGVLAHVMIDYNLQFVGNAVIFWMLLGFLTAIRSPVIRPPMQLRRNIEIALGTSLIVLAIFEGRYLIISSYGRHAEAQGRTEVALKYYGASAGEIFSRDLHLSEAFLLRKANRTKEAEQALTAYLRRNSLDARGWLQLGQTLEQEGNVELALPAFQQAYELGKWNHPDALRGLVATSFTLQQGKSVDARRTEFDALLMAYYSAILQNVHFIALGTVPDEFMTLVEQFASIYPNDAIQYRTMGKEAIEHAQAERKRFSARPAGRLW